MKCIINIIFILLITAFFLIPILEFEGQSHYAIFEPSKMRTSGEWVERNTIEPWQFIKDKIEEDGVSFVVGIPTIVMLLISVLAYQHIDKKYTDFYITNLILGIISLYMCTQFFPWKLMPQVLTNIQYPWRLIGLGMFFLIPVMAINVYYLLKCIKKEKIKNLIYICIIVVIGIFTILELSVYKAIEPGIDTEYEKTVKKYPIISHFNVNREYLPFKANTKQFSYLNTREDKTYILEGEATIVNEEKDGLHLIVNINQAKKDTILELPYLFYPGYAVELQTQAHTIDLNVTESENGFLKVILPEDTEQGNIIVRYTGTKLEKSGYAISVVGFIIFIGYVVYNRKKKQWREK